MRQGCLGKGGEAAAQVTSAMAAPGEGFWGVGGLDLECKSGNWWVLVALDGIGWAGR